MKNTTIKRRKYGGVNANIKNLLSIDVSKNSNINKIKKVMKEYIASPWNAVNNKILSKQEYNNYYNKLKKNKPNLNNNFCKIKVNTSKNIEYQKRLCQSHSGNLFEHSQWSALQIIKWYNEKDPIMENVNLRTAVISAFFHDIGKGGDCKKTCKNVCWFNMYASNKYNKKGDYVHPEYCGDMILGKIPFYIKCNNCNTDCKIYINNVIEDLFPDINIKEVALAAYMHWEFGKLNIPGKSEDEKIKIYLDTFKDNCIKVELEPNEKLLRLCIAVSCADITAGTNIRLLPSVNNIEPAPKQFLGKDPWTLFKMADKYLEYQQKVLDAYHK